VNPMLECDSMSGLIAFSHRVILASTIWCFVGCFSVIAKVEHVVHISVDGLRGDLLEQLIESNPTAYPTFLRFQNEGTTTFNARTDFYNTETLPNHLTMLSGRPVLRPPGTPVTLHHGFESNDDLGANQSLHSFGNPSLRYISSTFDVAHDNGLTTALYSGKDKFALFDRSYNEAFGAMDTIGVDNGRDKIDFSSITSLAHSTFAADFQTHKFDYSFLHYLFPDGVGHNSGWDTPEWNSIVSFVDNEIGKIMDVVEADPLLTGNTVLIVTSDHGGIGTSHGTAANPENYTIPLLVWGAGVARGADLYKLNPTTRLNPGNSRPTYASAIQPIRNGDTGNLALSLLGLGSVPGSSINAAQDLRFVPEPHCLLFVATLMLVGALLRQLKC
jgi:hypothetical protein